MYEASLEPSFDLICRVVLLIAQPLKRALLMLSRQRSVNLL